MIQKIFTDSIPNQVTDKPRKSNDALAKATVNALESIAIRQLRENRKLEDYYKMIAGELVWADYTEEEMSTIDAVKGLLAEDTKVPSFVKHYDLIGIIVNQLVGEWLETQEDFNVDCVDTYTENEFLRERKRRLEQYVTERFEIEVKKVMAEAGMSEEKEFETQEEQQAYLQQLEGLKNSIKSPEEIEKEMRTWKTQSVKWANSVLEQDNVRFRMENLVRTEMLDYACTGRYFRNYYVGFDYYKPERWHPIQVFFSREEDAVKPQDREFVGRQYRAPIYKVRERFGHKLTPNQLKSLDTFYGEFQDFTKEESLNTARGLTKALFGGNAQVPFYNYFEYQDALEAQELFGVPMGRQIVKDSEGEEMEIPQYLDNFAPNYHSRFGEIGRSDFEVRKDTVLITEGYYRSYKKMYIVALEDDSGVVRTEIFSEELLDEYIEENQLKKSNKKSLEEALKETEANTIYTFHQPVIRQFFKINSGLVTRNGKKGEIIVDEELDYQIKGNSELVDPIIPVAGIIDSNFIANKIRPYQIAYNICLNQIMNMMEKELGLFFLFDVNLLPSEYKTYGDTEDAMSKLVDFIRTTGTAPIDASKQNTGYQSPQGNSFVYQDISYTNHITARMQWAENWKRMAVEQIGMTSQRLGNPNQYETAEGIKQGVEASYAQTENIFSKMSQSYLESMEVHLAVAQYCQKNYKDADFAYTASDGSKAYIHLSDEAFPLRRFGVMPINSSKNKHQRQNLIDTLLNLNTLGGDILDYAEIYTAKSTQEILEAGKKARLKAQQEAEATRAHEQELVDKQLKAQAEETRIEREFKASENEKDRKADIIKAQLNALGRASFTENTDDDTNINKVAEMRLKEAQFESDVAFKETQMTAETTFNAEKLKLEKQKQDIEREKIAQKREESNNNLQIALSNKN